MAAKYLYLIKRGIRAFKGNVPFYPVIICDSKASAESEMGGSRQGDWLWVNQNHPASGWLLCRWEGLEIDYQPTASVWELPDGTHSCFWRINESWPRGIKELLEGAVWFSDRPIPEWLVERGVVYAPDEWTQQKIMERSKNKKVLPNNQYATPSFWPAPQAVPRWTKAGIGE